MANQGSKHSQEDKHVLETRGTTTEVECDLDVIAHVSDVRRVQRATECE